MSILKLFKPKDQEEQEVEEKALTVLSTSKKENSFIVPAKKLGKPIVSIQEFAGLEPIRVPPEELDPKTELQYMPNEAWGWVNSNNFYLHEDGTAVICGDRAVYLRFPRKIFYFDNYVKILKFKVQNQIVIAADADCILKAVKGHETHDWSSSLIRGDFYPVVNLTPEMRAVAPEI